ncbi:hypothetical protein POTOM_017466 [Populus tomentosa]|uniref:Uncharacterized protein n=1 Tax=Populus tomentosa TaxID=118781 RepID=A0A8X8AAS8_POPTO|nr:hypothetical protein POTOM_017466 [Populus tomentosa]
MGVALTISCPKSATLQKPSSLKDLNSSFLGGPLKDVSSQLKPRRERTDKFSLVIAAPSNTSTSTCTNSGGGGRFYLNFTGFPFPLGPFLDRRTIRTEAVKIRMYRAIRTRASIRFSRVSTNIRMTVIKLKSGGLWVHAPIAPTKECIQYCEGIQGQCHMPLIASSSLVMGHRVIGAKLISLVLRSDLILPAFEGVGSSRIGPYVDVAFYHKLSRTLLVTDAVIFGPRKPPECISKESLLASAKNGLAAKLLSKGKEIPQEPVVDNQMNRQKGWERMVLQILFLGPSNLLEPNTSFAQMSQKLIVSPMVKTLVFSKVPEKIRDWIDSIVRDWKFKRIIPAHFAAPINTGRSEFLAAFAFLDDLLGERYITRPSLSLLFTSIMGKAASYFPPDDMKTLSSLDQFLVSVGAVKKTASGRKKTA